MIKEKWTAAFAPKNFIAGTHTTSRGESLNAQIKTKINSRSTLVEILRHMQELDERVVEKCETDYKHNTPLVLNNPMLEEMYQLYTRHSFEHMLYQYMHSHYLVV